MRQVMESSGIGVMKVVAQGGSGNQREAAIKPHLGTYQQVQGQWPRGPRELG